MRPRPLLLSVALGLVASGASSVALTAAPGQLACSVADMQSAAPADTTITAAEHLAAPVPHCRVEGYVTVTNPGPNRDYFRLQLPEKALWKHRFYFIGLGGSAGYVPTDSQTPPGNPMVKGFAVAGTDTGHRGSLLDWTFLSDPAKALDHTHRAAHVTTVAAQQLTRAYYGVGKMYRYETGCSGGGRMGGEAIMRHPADYDGVLLGDGRVNYRPLRGVGNYKFIHASQVLTREPGAWLSPAKLAFADAQVTKACDATDGAVDGIVWDHRQCKFDFDQLRCKSGDGAQCLTQPEITSIKQLLDGAHGPDGKLLVDPWPITNMTMWSTFLGSTPPPWSPESTPANMSRAPAAYIIAHTRVTGLLGPDVDVLKFDLKDQKQIDALETRTAQVGFEGAPDLTPFSKTGGKVLLYVGVSSPCCSNLEMEGYVAKVRRELGPEQADKFMAMYQLPGIGHCAGGPGPQDGVDRLLQALIDWVELDKRPGPVVAHRGPDRVQPLFASVDTPMIPRELRGDRPDPVVATPQPSRDFLLCPYPQKSVFDKTKAGVPGAVYDARNWSCR